MTNATAAAAPPPHNKHPALNGELFMHSNYKKKYKSYTNYKITPLMQAMWKMRHRLFRYIAKMAAVEYEKCIDPHSVV